MPYNENGDYLYEAPLLASGGALDVAARQLAHDVEEYLFDGKAPGHNKPEFLSWALARFEATKQSSGNLANQFLYWDPQSAGEKHQVNPALNNTWTPGTQVDLGVRYPEAAFDHPGIDTDSKVGPADAYAHDEAHDPAMASRMTVREPKIVAQKHYVEPTPEPVDEPKDGDA